MYRIGKKNDIDKEARESGIELLKIIGIVLIIMYHIRGSAAVAGDRYECVDNIDAATTNLQYIILMLFGYFGPLGNNIFFISSAWFLCGSSKKRNNKKILHMLLDVWTISILYLFLFIILGESVPSKDIIKSIFPTICNNNWYITCYVLFYAIFPYLNQIIEKMTQRELLTINIVHIVLYYGISFIIPAFFMNGLVLFIVMYFFIAYIKFYMGAFFEKKGVNFTIITGGGVFCIGLTVLTNFVRFKVDYLPHQENNPLLLIIAIALFQIFRQKSFVNAAINRVAGLSLYIYIIHENLLVRTIFRPRIFLYIDTYMGYQHILLWVLAVAALFFIVSVLASLIYKYTIYKLTSKLSHEILKKAAPVYESCINILMKFQ